MEVDEPIVEEPKNSDIPTIPTETTLTETVVVVPIPSSDDPPKDKGYELYKSVRKNCKAVDTLALDFINEQIHHPVISCLREITKHDIMTILNNPLFKDGSDKLEQCLMCISLLDVIATSIKNPLYSDNFNKLSQVQTCTKKIFQELRRLLKDWATSDLSAFKSSQHMIIRYLHGLTHFFKVINYDVSFEAAVGLLARGAVRYHKRKSLPVPRNTRPSNNISGSNIVECNEERSALVEIATNVASNNTTTTTDESFVVQDKSGAEDEKDEHDISDEHIFDVLDSKTKDVAMIFNGVNRDKPKVTKVWNPIKKSNLTSMFRNQLCDSKKLQQQQATKNNSENKASSVIPNKDPARIGGLKRPSVEALENPAKKSCTDASSRNSTSQSPKKSLSSESTLSTIPTITISSTSPQKPGPPKNAFTFLMNRQKEIAHEDKIKKAGKKTPATKSKSSKA